MKRFYILCLCCCMFASAFAQNGRIPLSPSTQKSGRVQVCNMNGFNTTFSFNSIESQPISNEKGSFSEIYIHGSFPSGDVGNPNLPMITKMIAIPEGATPTVTINGYSENEFALDDYQISTLSAKQASLAKNIDPTTVEYVVNTAAYSQNVYNETPIASVEYLGTLCGMRLGRLTIRPVAYNPVAKSIKVFNDINVSVTFNGGNAATTNAKFASTYSPAFNSIYDQLLNKNVFGQTTAKGIYDDRPDMHHSPVRMLVVCYSGFRNNAKLNEWLTWKLQKGYYIDIFYTDETGTTSANIASFIKTKYNNSVNSGNAYSYLIVIGDTGQVPAYSVQYESGSEEDCASDIGYASVDYATTNDYYPEMLYSRMSVENATHLENYITKVLMYEKYTFPDGGNYLNNVKIVGGWDASWTSRVARPTVEYASTYYFNNTNTTYGGFENGTISTTVSTSSSQGWSGTNNGVYSGLNNGFCFLNYTAHGNKQEWSQPRISVAEVAQFNNTDKYFFAVGNCCLTGNFNNTERMYTVDASLGTTPCFAETMIRVPNKGAVAYIGSSPVSYWYEDFYWGVGSGINFNNNSQLVGTATTANTTMGVYDAMFTDAYWNSVSSLLNIGSIAIDASRESNHQTATDDDYYWKWYHAFGDGSIMPYVTKPEVNNVTIPASTFTGATSVTINAQAGSYVAITDNEQTIYGVALADNSGVANVNLTNIPSTGTLYVVVTRQQYQPYFGQIAIIAPNPPTAEFTATPTTILERETVTFTNNSQYAASCTWNFGDGQTSNETNPTHTYATPGTYTVSLYVENTLGNDTETKTNYITVNVNTNPPVADFSADNTNVEQGGTVHFSDASQNIATSWSWSFEGGTPATSTEQNPTVTYEEPGNFTVTLTATNAYGQDVETKTDYITVFFPEILMSNETVYACGGIYQDSNGDANYAANSNYTQTIYPSTQGAKLQLEFTEFALQASSGWSGCSDKFYIYDGTTATGTPVVNGICGTNNPGTITATNAEGALTIKFTSNQNQQAAGWTANISCYIPPAEIEVASYTPQTARFNTTNNTLSLTLANTGGAATSANTQVTLSTTDEYLSLQTASTNVGSITNQANTTADFTFAVDETAPDGHVANINVNIADETSTWTEQITITIEGPSCQAPTGLQVIVNGTNAEISWDTETIIPYTISEDFENHTAFTVNSAGTIGWTYIDGDGATTGALNGYTIPQNSGAEMAYIVVDPSQVTSSNAYTNGNLADNANVTAHSGNQFIASFYASGSTNDDWIVSPELNFNGDFTFSFYCRGGHRTNNRTYPETYEVRYSTTTNNKAAFTNLLENTTVQGSNQSTWTFKTYTVPQEAKFVAIKYASNDQYYFCIDDITISGNIISGAGSVNVYDNGRLISAANTTGEFVATDLHNGEHCFDLRAVCNDQTESLAVQECTTVTNGTTLPEYTITITANQGGTVSPTGTQTVLEGYDFTFNVTPNNCYEIASVTINGTAVQLSNNSYAIENVTSNQNVQVNFRQISYTITASVVGNGTITPMGDNSVNCGENITFAIAANEGYYIADVLVNGQSVGAVDSYTFTNVNVNGTITAQFAQNNPPVQTECSTVTNLQATYYSFAEDLWLVEVTWTAAENAVSYSVYRNGTLAYTLDATETSISDIAGNVGDSYYVITNCEGDNQSEPSETVVANGDTQEEICYSVSDLTATREAYGVVLAWTAAENAVMYNIYRNAETEPLASVINPGYVDAGGTEADTYYIITVCEFGLSGASEIANVTNGDTQEEICYSVSDLTATREAYGVVLAWTAAENAVMYNIYRNAETEPLASVINPGYVDVEGTETDTYYIITVCEFGLSEASAVANVITTSIIDESLNLNLYPNPATTAFTIECDNMQTVEIFNTLGQIIERYENTGSSLKIDASSWSSSVYQVRIITNTGNFLQKQVVKQ